MLKNKLNKLFTFLLIILLCVSMISFIADKNVKANPSWLTGWSYRKSHVINSASGSGTNYQIKIKVHYGSGSDSGEDVYCNSHCRTDFGDIRFTDDDETTLLDYWMEEKVDGDYVVFWVEVADDLSSSSTTIFMYYGNSGATTTSNGGDTFLFFDDFNDLTSWSGDTSSFSVSSGILSTSSSMVMLQYEGANYSDVAIRTKFRGTDSTDARAGITARGGYYSGGGVYGEHWNRYRSRTRVNANDDLGIGKYLNAGATDVWLTTVSYTFDTNTWYINEFRLYGSSLKIYIDDVEQSSTTDSDLTSGYVGLETFVNSGFNYPVNSSASIVNMDDTDNLYAQYKWYIAVSNHSDADGYADIYYVEFRLNQSSTSYAIFRYVEDNDTFKIVVGSDKWDFDTSSSSAIKSGNWINVTWKFKPQWDAVQDSDLEIECYVIDSGSATDQDVMQTNYCDVITDLAVSNFSVNNARGNVGATITLSGKVHYSGYVSRSPPDSEFNCVQIWNSI